MLDPTALADRLARSLLLLTGGAKGAPHRLQTMRNAIAWSYDLLSADEQALFRRLAVFVGGIPLAVVEGDLDTISSLVNKHLVRRVARENGEARFSMFETIREYGLEQLAAAGEEEAARDAHAAYFAGLAKDAERWLKRAEQVVWLDRLDAERDNLRVALAWLPERGAIEQALSMAGWLWLFWRLREHRAESCQRCEALLARPDATGRTVGRATALIGAGTFARDFQRALTHLEEALAIFRECGDRAGAAWALYSIYLPLKRLGDTNRAFDCITESVALYRELGDQWGTARALNKLGCWWCDRGEWERGRSLVAESLWVGRTLGDRLTIGMALNNLALFSPDWLSAEAVDLVPEQALLEESVHLMRELGNKEGVARSLCNLSGIRQRRGDSAGEATLLAEALALAREIGDTDLTTVNLFFLGTGAYLHDDPYRAISLLRESLALFRELESTPWMTRCLERIAFLANSHYQGERAARLLGAAARLHECDPIAPTGYERSEYERGSTKIRNAVGDPSFAIAWEAGRALSLDDVVAEVAAVETAILAVPPSPRMKPNVAAAHGLSPRELDVLRLLAEGHSDREIGEALYISRRTAATHVANILTKLDLHSRTAAAA